MSERETVYTETLGGITEYWTWSDHQRIYIGFRQMRLMTGQGARLIRLNG